MKTFKDTLSTRTSTSSGGGALLEVLCVTDNGMSNEGAWAALGQSLASCFLNTFITLHARLLRSL